MKVWIARILVFAVFAVNMYCIICFIFLPGNYLNAYELIGVPGKAALQGIGVAFLMWNTTYPLVIVRPDKHRVLFLVVLAQQIVGLLGETFILLTLPGGHDVLASNITRFIIFDAAGLVLLTAAFFLSRKSAKERLKDKGADQNSPGTHGTHGDGTHGDGCVP